MSPTPVSRLYQPVDGLPSLSRVLLFVAQIGLKRRIVACKSASNRIVSLLLVGSHPCSWGTLAVFGLLKMLLLVASC